MSLPRNPTRSVQVGSVTIGGGSPMVMQSICATKTSDVEATVAQVNQLAVAGAGVVVQRAFIATTGGNLDTCVHPTGL